MRDRLGWLFVTGRIAVFWGVGFVFRWRVIFIAIDNTLLAEFSESSCEILLRRRFRWVFWALLSRPGRVWGYQQSWLWGLIKLGNVWDAPSAFPALLRRLLRGR